MPTGIIFGELWVDCAKCANAEPLCITDKAPKAEIDKHVADLGYVKGQDGKYRCRPCRSK